MEQSDRASFLRHTLAPPTRPMTSVSPSYHDYDEDADVFGIFPELLSGDHLGVVNDSEGEDEQTEQLHQHGGLKTQQKTQSADA